MLYIIYISANAGTRIIPLPDVDQAQYVVAKTMTKYNDWGYGVPVKMYLLHVPTVNETQLPYVENIESVM